MDPVTISGALESIKVAAGIGKALLNLKIEGETQTKVIAINEALLNAHQRMFEVQESHAEMAEKVRKLENELTKYQSWEQEKKRYQLTKTDAGNHL